MPVVLTEDLDNLAKQQGDDYKATLGNPFKSSPPIHDDWATASPNVTAPSGPTPPPDVAEAQPTPPTASPTPPSTNDPLQSALNWGQQQIGKGYIWGSAGGRSDLSGQAPGYDCSGFVSQFYHQMGLAVPAQTAAAYSATSHLDQADAKPGDIVEFNMNSNDPHEQHIAVYLGNGKIMQSGGTRHDVNIGSVDQFGPGTFEFRRAKGFTPQGDTSSRTDLASTASTVAKQTTQGQDARDNTVPTTAGTYMPAGDSTPQVDTPPPIDPQTEAAQFKSSLGDPFASAGSAIGDAASALGSGAQSALQQAQDFKNSLGNPFTEPAGLPASAQPTPSDSLTNPTLTPGMPSPSPVAPPAPQPTIQDQVSQSAGDAYNSLPPGTLLTGGMNVANAAVPHTQADPTAATLPPAGPVIRDMVAPYLGNPDAAANDPIVRIGTDNPPTRDELVKAAPVVGGIEAPLSRDDLAAVLKQYPADIQKTFVDFAKQELNNGSTPKQINDGFRLYVKNNPPDTEALAIGGPEPTAAPQADAASTPAVASPQSVPVEPTTQPESLTGTSPSGKLPTDTPSPQPLTDAVPGGQVDEMGNPVNDVAPPPVAGARQAEIDAISQRGVAAGRVGKSSTLDSMQSIADRQATIAKTKASNPAPVPQTRVSSASTADEFDVPLLGGDRPVADAPTPQATLPRQITPDLMQTAHEAIDSVLAATQADHDELDRLVSTGANPADLARFMAKVEGKTVSPTSVLQSLRTGSLAGGDTTEAKVLLAPVIQTAMRAPVGALKAIVTGHPGNIATAMEGGISGLSEGAHDALQTLMYGVSDRAALGGGASGGFGHPTGLDVLGKNRAQRLVGTALLGAVRTHGAMADIAAGIGRGSAKALGASNADAAEAGQQWAMRSGNYGTMGQAFSKALGTIKDANPALNVMGQILVPFYRVGYNATTQGIERSPLGIVGTGLDVARGKLPASSPSWLKGPYAVGGNANKAVTPVGDRLANNMFGIGLAAGGLGIAASGNLTGEHPTNGDPKWSVQVAGHWIPLRTLGPAGESLAQSAILFESARDGNGDVGRSAELSAAAYVGHVNDETWLRSVGDIFEMIGNDAKNIGTTRDTQAKNDILFKLGAQGKSFIPQEKAGEQIAGAVQGSSQPTTQSSSSSSTPVAPAAPARGRAPEPVRKVRP